MLGDRKIADGSKQELTILAKARSQKAKNRTGLEQGIIKQEQESKISFNGKTRPWLGQARLNGSRQKHIWGSSLRTQ